MAKRWLRFVGYLVGTDQEEFLGAYGCPAPGVECFGYVRLIELAQVFATSAEARLVAERIGKPGVEVVPLYDCGKRWVVSWPAEWNIGRGERLAAR